MHIRVRQALFWVFVLIFVIGAPVIVLYTAGYRINPYSGRLQRTGVIAISTEPSRATITLNGAEQRDASPAVLQRIATGEYTLELSRKGYHSWLQHIDVEGGNTTYVNTTMFADAQPELLLEEQYTSAAVSPDGRTVALLITSANVLGEVWLFDIPSRTEHQLAEFPLGTWQNLAISWSGDGASVVLANDGIAVAGFAADDGTALSSDEVLIATLGLLPFYHFSNNGANIELTDMVSSGPPVALLPLGDYTISYRNDDIAIFHDERGHAYSLTFATNTVASIDMPIGLLDWSEQLGVFLASDAYELDIVEIASGTRTFITRQSTPITAVAWHPNGQAMLIGTQDGIVAIDHDIHTTRVVTPLASGVSVASLWVDQTERYLYFIGTQNDITGIYRLRLIK